MKDTLDKSIKELFATAKISALSELKTKIQEEILELERQKAEANELPF